MIHDRGQTGSKQDAHTSVYWIFNGVRAGSAQGPHGVRTGSEQGPNRVRTGSVRALFKNSAHTRMSVPWRSRGEAVKTPCHTRVRGFKSTSHSC
jgi:hypothetical protein